MPGQFGPISLEPVVSRKFLIFSMSMAGMPSVMATISPISASIASIMAPAAKAGGTKIMLQLADVAPTASRTVSNTGVLSIFCPPFPGVTPATTLVPYRMHCRA